MNGNEKHYDTSINGLFFLILIFYLSLVFGCGTNEDVRNNSGDGRGTYVAKLIFPPDIPGRNTEKQSSVKGVEGGIDCEKYGIVTINCALSSADNRLVAQENWQCSEGKGLVSNIPEGTGITVSVSALDGNGTIILSGEEANVAIVADHRTEGEIVLQQADLPEVAAGDDPRTLRFNWPHITFPGGVERYQLQVDPDGNSGDSEFSTIENADDIQGTDFTITIPVHLTDWVNAAYRVAALDAAGHVLAFSSEINLIPNVLSEEVIGYFKASNTDAYDSFGRALAVSADGNTLAVGAYYEDSTAMGIDGDQGNDTMGENSGAVYVFTRSGDTWRQQAYVKASNTDTLDLFGYSIALSGDGSTLAVSAFREDSAAMGTDGNQSDNSMEDSGAVYIFTRNGDTWRQQAYIKASNPDIEDLFGFSVALSGDGSTLAVGAPVEASAAMGIDGDQGNDTMGEDSGAVYVFTRSGDTWQQQAYVKASNTGILDQFGYSVALSSDGNTLAVGANTEDSAAVGIGGDEIDNSMIDSGAVYVFTRSGDTWQQQAYVKAGNTDAEDYFGNSIVLSNDGNTLAVGAYTEDSAAVGIDGDQGNEDIMGKDFGAVYVFTRSGDTWQQQAYVKASNTFTGSLFGHSVALSNNGDTLAVGSVSESSPVKGIGSGDEQLDVTTLASGAVYVFTRSSDTWRQQAYVKASNTDMGDSFGYAVSLSADGEILAVGATAEASAARGINGNEADNSLLSAGAVYLY